MPIDRLTEQGVPYSLRDEDKVAFDDAKFTAEDELPSILVAPFTGDRGDIGAAIRWNKGKWTVSWPARS